jgi:hypothetical protein
MGTGVARRDGLKLWTDGANSGAEANPTSEIATKWARQNTESARGRAGNLADAVPRGIRP